MFMYTLKSKQHRHGRRMMICTAPTFLSQVPTCQTSIRHTHSQKRFNMECHAAKGHVISFWRPPSTVPQIMLAISHVHQHLGSPCCMVHANYCPINSTKAHHVGVDFIMQASAAFLSWVYINYYIMRYIVIRSNLLNISMIRPRDDCDPADCSWSRMPCLRRHQPKHRWNFRSRFRPRTDGKRYKRNQLEGGWGLTLIMQQRNLRGGGRLIFSVAMHTLGYTHLRILGKVSRHICLQLSLLSHISEGLEQPRSVRSICTAACLLRDSIPGVIIVLRLEIMYMLLIVTFEEGLYLLIVTFGEGLYRLINGNHTELQTSFIPPLAFPILPPPVSLACTSRNKRHMLYIAMIQIIKINNPSKHGPCRTATATPCPSRTAASPRYSNSDP